MKIICSSCQKYAGEKEPLENSSTITVRCAKCLKKRAERVKHKRITPLEEDYLPRTFSFSNEFLEKTRKFWEPRYGHPLTLEDAREIANNLCGFITLLAAVDRKQKDNS